MYRRDVLILMITGLLITLIFVEMSIINKQERIINQQKEELAWWKCDNKYELPKPPTLVEDQ